MPSAHENKTVNLALQVLLSVVPTSSIEGSTRELRLALRVVRTYARDTDCVTEFWQNATNPHRKVHETCIGPYTILLIRLKRAGFQIDPDNDLYTGTI